MTIAIRYDNMPVSGSLNTIFTKKTILTFKRISLADTGSDRFKDGKTQLAN